MIVNADIYCVHSASFQSLVKDCREFITRGGRRLLHNIKDLPRIGVAEPISRATRKVKTLNSQPVPGCDRAALASAAQLIDLLCELFHFGFLDRQCGHENLFAGWDL